MRHILSHISTATHKLRRTLGLMLLMVTLGAGTAWGQVGTDYSGTYYIASDYQTAGTTNRNYDPTTLTDNFYLCPTENWISYSSDSPNWTTGDEKPFLTTYQAREHANDQENPYDITKAKWTIEYYTTESGKDYYYFKHSSGKYMVLNNSISAVTGNNNAAMRLRVHLETLTSEQLKVEETRNRALFSITQDSRSIVIKPKTQSSYQLTVNNGNSDYLRGYGTGKGYIQDGSIKYGTEGTIAIYNNANDDNKYFYLEDYITRPTISYSSGNNVTITYTTSATIYYTTDGSDPTDSENTNRSSFTGTSKTVSFTDVAVVKAAAYIGNEYSNIATYVYVHTSSDYPYLLQSVANTSFYMLAGDASGSNTTVNTSSLPQAGMSWIFEPAGVDNGVQFYFIKNTSSNGYLCRDNNTFLIKQNKGTGDDYKFSVIPYLNESGVLAGFYLYNLGKKQYVYKGNNSNVIGNGSDGAVNLTGTADQDLARWNLILVANKSFPEPVTLSDNSSVTYYTIASSNASTQLITPPTETSTYVKTSNGVSDNQKWYFVSAENDGWTSYYYIINGLTGEAMYFGKEATSTTISDALEMKPLPATPSDNYKFALAHTVTDGEYYIVPKPLAQYTKTKYSAVWYVNASSSLQTQSNRASNQIKWQISQVVDYVAPPYIKYDVATNTATISSTYPGATIYYTTDGTEATTSSTNSAAPIAPNSTASTSFVLTAGITTIRAIVYKEGTGTSSESTYSIPFQLTLSDAAADQRPYLIQSQNNAWNSTDFHFYMIPGDEASGILKVNTTSLFRPSMEWYFLNAGKEDGVQYYYIVNNANSKNLCYDSTNGVYMDDFGSGGNKFKFKIVESVNTGSFNIIPYDLRTASGNTNRFICKPNNGNIVCNANANPINLNNADNAHSKWKFVLSSALDKTAPFLVSVPASDSYSYYKIGNVGNSGYYIVPGATNATTSNSASDNMNWYFEVAQAANASDWLTYYHIRNAETGDYLYFTKDDNDAGACLATSSTITEGSEDRYMFTWAKTADANVSYYIVPKLLKDKSKNQFSTLRRDNGTLKTNLTRGAGTYAWTFVSSTYTCAQPVITWSASDGGYVVTSTESDAKIYYKIGEGTLTPSTGTLYTGAISVADLGVESATIRAIAARNSDGSDKSPEISVTVSRVATPSISQTEDGKVEITCATAGASIRYEMGVSPNNPTANSTPYTGPIEGAAGKVIKAIAVKDEMINSAVETSATIVFSCAKPVIRKTSPTTFTIECSFPSSGVTIRYTKGDGTQDSPTASSGTIYTEAVTFSTDELPFTVKAIAIATDYNNSDVAEKQLVESLDIDEDGYYRIAYETDFNKFVDMVNSDGASYKYKITNDITLHNPDEIIESFTGELTGVAKADGSLPVVSGMNHAIFRSINGGIVKNIILDNVTISSGTNVGVICNEATGDSRIYNCGVLATNSTVSKDSDGYDVITSCSSTINGSGYVGSIVGLLDGSSRVINCFSYANVSGGSYVGGIVGYNNVATTASNLKTMVMNCMFYGEVSGSSIAPIYNGMIITNDGDADGVNNFNYFRLESSYIQNTGITKEYNCALGAETRFLQRFEFFRHLLNSNRELAAWWATDDAGNKDEMMKWVMEPTQIGTTTPYPILKNPEKYASVVNYTPSTTAYDEENRNKGRKLTSEGDNGMLHVTISMGSAVNGKFSAPSGAGLKQGENGMFDLTITDKDFEHFNYNYGKVQLPYYNDYCVGNYTGNRVVTGWKIVRITVNGAPTTTGTGSYSTGDDVTYTNGELTATPYNFADRSSTKKDLYSQSGRVFNQGAYWDVPEGVTAITIEPYWGKAVYLSDAYWDVVYQNGEGSGTGAGTANDAMTTAAAVPYVGGGERYKNGKKYNLATHSLDDTNGQTVYTSMSNAIAGTALFSENVTNPTVYDYAVVLVGNYHHTAAIEANKNYTVTSIDLDGDNEPDYSLMLRFNSRIVFHPVKYDFLNLIGLGMAQKTTGGTGSYNLGIMQPKAWFEVTNTALFRVTQFEYSKSRTKSPYILQGGVIEQWVTQQQDAGDGVSYFHIGGNVWFKEFHRGSHQDNADKSTPHPPVSVTGGDFAKFYLTGYYQSQAAIYDDNAECYINGGRFGEMAGAGMEGIGTSDGKGNITWVINNADIKEFYGGGINYDKPVHGNIHTIISNSYVNQFCGGPKFGDMEDDRTVTTTATNCTFGTYFGAGYGGNAYNRQAPRNHNNIVNFPHNDGQAGNHSSWNTWLAAYYKQDYNATYKGVSTQFDYQFLPMSSNTENVARIFVEYVGFSLATTHDVNSSLTGCTVTGNFYGGGSLGKVDGNVTSTLTNCTVNGSAFGAGYSASLPTVEVMDIGFVTEPYYYTDLGTYRTGVLPTTTTTTFTWEHSDEDEINTTEKAINKTDNNHILYTTENLNELGSVSGSVSLILTTSGQNGKTTIGNDVYGGGDESSVTNTDTPANASTTVSISGNTEIMGNVFGGGNEGEVSGSTTVNIQQ